MHRKEAPQESLFHPTHHDIGVDMMGPPGYPLPPTFSSPGQDLLTCPSFPETEEEGMGLPRDGSKRWPELNWPSLRCSVLLYGASEKQLEALGARVEPTSTASETSSPLGSLEARAPERKNSKKTFFTIKCLQPSEPGVGLY